MERNSVDTRLERMEIVLKCLLSDVITAQMTARAIRNAVAASLASEDAIKANAVALIEKDIGVLQDSIETIKKL
nr:MAG TPA: hypothetical protein [Caudoviricetes sp.]